MNQKKPWKLLWCAKIFRSEKKAIKSLKSQETRYTNNPVFDYLILINWSDLSLKMVTFWAKNVHRKLSIFWKIIFWKVLKEIIKMNKNQKILNLCWHLLGLDDGCFQVLQIWVRGRTGLRLEFASNKIVQWVGWRLYVFGSELAGISLEPDLVVVWVMDLL